MMIRTCGIVLLASALAAAGCGSTPTTTSDKPTKASGDSAYPNLLVGPEVSGELGYSIQWQTPLELPRNVRITFARVVNGNRLVLLDSDNVGYVINTDSGKLLWATKIGRALERFEEPRMDDTRLILCSETRAYVYDIDRGDQLGIVNLYYGTNVAPVVINGLMVHANGAGYIWGQDLTAGIRRWQYKMPAGIIADPILAGSTVLVTNASGLIAMFNPESGQVLWQQQAFERISADPRATELLVFVASEDHSLYAFERTTGNLRWRHFARDPLLAPPMLTGDLVVINEPRRGLVAIDSFSGEEKWLNPLEDADLIQRHDDLLQFIAGHTIHQLSPANGETYGTIEVPKVDRILSDKDVSGQLYMINDADGRVMKLSPR